MSKDLLKDSQSKRLLAVLSKMQSPEDFRRFLLDLCTPSELEAMADRLEAARLIQEGNSYREIAEKIGASSATITRVGRTLKYGAKGYETALNLLNNPKDESL